MGGGRYGAQCLSCPNLRQGQEDCLMLEAHLSFIVISRSVCATV